MRLRHAPFSDGEGAFLLCELPGRSIIMKKFFCVLFALLLIAASAAAETVYVTISDGQGKIVLAHEAVDVADADSDGALTVYDALYAAHEAHFEGGAEAGFAAGDMGYGLSLTRLWGEENGGSYGYYVNDASAYSLTDPLAEGDRLHAFVYTDLESWSDLYCFFSEAEVIECTPGENVSLTLNVQTYDADWNAVVSPMEGATLTIDGEDAQVITDAEGIAQLSFGETGVYLVSARSDEAVLVPPVCIVNVVEAQ